MEIKNYEVLINEENAQCGLIVDLDNYNIRNLIEEDKLLYEVNVDEKKINVFNQQDELLLTFHKIDSELILYAFKTDHLSILGGVTEPKAEIQLFLSASLK